MTSSNAHLWEHQRAFIPGKWGTRLLRGDPPPWATDTMEQASPPVESYQLQMDETTDADGWMYAPNFQAANWVAEASRHCFVRRRCWVRSLVPSCQTSVPPAVVHPFQVPDTRTSDANNACATRTAYIPEVQGVDAGFPFQVSPKTSDTPEADSSDGNLLNVPFVTQNSSLSEGLTAVDLSQSASSNIGTCNPKLGLHHSTSEMSSGLPQHLCHMEKAASSSSINPPDSGRDQYHSCSSSAATFRSCHTESNSMGPSEQDSSLLEAESMTYSLAALLNTYGFNLDRRHFLLEGCETVMADRTMFLMSGEGDSCRTVSMQLPVQEGEIASGAAHHLLAGVGDNPGVRSRPGSLPSSPAATHRTDRMRRLTGNPMQGRRLMESVYFLGDIHGPDVPDTVWAMDPVHGPDGGAPPAFSNGRLSLFAAVEGQTLWLDKPVLLPDTVIPQSPAPVERCDALQAATIVSARHPCRSSPPIARSAGYPQGDCEPVLSDDECTELSRIKSTGVGRGAADEPAIVSFEVPHIVPGLLLLHVLQAAPLALLPNARYYVRARVQPGGGWVESSGTADAKWCQDLILCPPETWTSLELRVYSAVEALGGQSPILETVGLCPAMPRSQLMTAAELQLPLLSGFGEVGGPNVPVLSLIVSTGEAHISSWPSQRPSGLDASLIRKHHITSATATNDALVTVARNEPAPCLSHQQGPPRLEVTILCAESLLSKEELHEVADPVEVYVAMTLPGISPGWYRTGIRDAMYPVWNEMVPLPVHSHSSLSVLELQLFTARDDCFLGQALVPLDGLQEDCMTTVKVKLGIVAENGSLLVALNGPPREVQLRLCPRRFSTALVSKQGAPHASVWQYNAEAQGLLLCRYMRAAGRPLRRHEAFLKGESLHVLEIEVLELHAPVAVPAVLMMQMGSTTLATGTAVCRQGRAMWNEQFLLELEVDSPLCISLACTTADDGSLLGRGHLDLTRIPWHKADRQCCSVRLMADEKNVATAEMVLTQRPTGSLQWLVAAQEGRRLLFVEWEEALLCGMALEAEERQLLFSDWEATHRKVVQLQEHNEWLTLAVPLQRCLGQLDLFLQALCSMRVKLQKTCRIYVPDDCQLVLHLGQQTFSTPWSKPSDRGILCWHTECVLKYAGIMEDVGLKVLREPLSVVLNGRDGVIGIGQVELTDLHWRQERPIVVTMADGSCTRMTVEALDFGFSPEVEDEDPMLEVEVKHAIGLPEGGGLTSVVVRVPNSSPWRTSSQEGANPTWEEAHQFDMAKKPSTLEIYVYNQEMLLQEALVGTGTVNLSTLIRDQPTSIRCPLQGCSSCSVQLQLCARGFGILRPHQSNQPDILTPKKTSSSLSSCHSSADCPVLPVAPDYQPTQMCDGPPLESTSEYVLAVSDSISSAESDALSEATVVAPRQATEENQQPTNTTSSSLSSSSEIPVPNATLGLTLSFRLGDLGEEQPVIMSMKGGGPAALAGLQAGDILQSWDGVPLQSREAFTSKLRQAIPGQPIMLEVCRRSQALPVKVVPVSTADMHLVVHTQRSHPPSQSTSQLGSPRHTAVSPQRIAPPPRQFAASPQRSMSSPSKFTSPRRTLFASPRTPRTSKPATQEQPGTPLAKRPVSKANGPPQTKCSALGDISNVPQ